MFGNRYKYVGFAIIATFYLFISSVNASEKKQTLTKPKFIFFMIGDGMGTAQRTVAEMYKRIETKSAVGETKGQLIMNQFPVKGLTTTQPFKGLITDSAAAATALACGEKTKNGIVSMSPNLKTNLKSVAYFAKEAGMKVGIVSCVAIDHATPACFYACAPRRGDYYNIAVQVSKSDFNYFAGGSFYGLNSANTNVIKSSKDYAREAGYTIYKEREGLDKIKNGDDKIIWEANILFSIDKNSNDVTLAELTRKGIEVLDNSNGFFMMVESGKLDWTGHANDLAANIRETLSFDDAIAEAYDFYKKHPDETLIVVTGDHETGGIKTDFSGGFSPETFIAAVKSQKISGAELQNKIKIWADDKITFEDTLQKIIENFGLKNLSANEKNNLTRAINYTFKYKTIDKRPKAIKQMYGSKNMIANECQNIIAKRCGITWTTFGHSGIAVKTTAIGPGSINFGGQNDNTDIAKSLIMLIR